ncbi:MAG: histidine phosphatase family protein [Dehalococcoidia bacterium]|nr:histidine phosphatase family protein [Dehalococcoidia bacterium]
MLCADAGSGGDGTRTDAGGAVRTVPEGRACRRGRAGWARRLRPSIPGEEGRAEFFERVCDVIERLLEREGTMVAVTHGGVVNAACHHAVGLDYVQAPQRFRVGNCSLTEIRRDRQGRLLLARHNDTCHLEIVTQANPG